MDISEWKVLVVEDTDDDLDVGVSGFRVTPTQFIFHRKDACGEFDIVKPFPGK